MLGLFFSLAVVNAQFAFSDPSSVHSVSGQFVVSSTAGGAPFFRSPAAAADTNLVRLEPALLAVAAERFKISLWHELGLAPDTAWSGKVFLVQHPARSPDEPVNIVSSPFLNRWDYRVELPDVLTQTRYARALSAVLLLEIANRAAGSEHSAEVPAWLVDGLAQQVLAADGERVVLSAPAKKPGGLPGGRVDQTAHSFDPLITGRRVLQEAPALTFDQLSWPTDAQMNGADGGLYQASAQLFVVELLKLKNGPAKLRRLLAELPAHLNWQTAFFAAFPDDFSRPLDVEKWWAVRVVNFVARSPGPRWTADVSRDRLASLLSVPVEFRADSNALPTHAEISLPAALQNLDPAQRDYVLRIKVRDLGLVELRLAPPFGGLADGYRLALADFLGGNGNRPAPDGPGKPHSPAMKRQVSIGDTLDKLAALDRRRREAETEITVLLPGNVETPAP